MNIKYLLLLFLTIQSYNIFAQAVNPYCGVVVNTDKTPVDVFSVVVFNTKDSTKQLYANTFSNGNFNINFTPKLDEKYGVYLLSVGYAETYINLEALKDTIIIRKKSMRINDVVVQGKREVKTEMGTYGGLAYDVSNTYLSDMGTSTKLLNFIPGVSVSDLGDVKLLNSRDAVVIYINNVKIENTEKLLSLKSEDIKSVEVITNPVARFKGAKAVLYIKTNRVIDGFSSRVSNLYMVGDRMTYEAPSAEMSFTKNKITISGAYRYTLRNNFTSTENVKNLDESVYKGGWQIDNNGINKSNSDNHWYNTNLNYTINSQNTFVAEYTGSTYYDITESLSEQPVSTMNQGMIYNNIISRNNTPKNANNRIHLSYIGEYSEKFNITTDIDFSSKTNKNYYTNLWKINDILTEETSNENFIQKENNHGYAITSEILLNNIFKNKHTLTYGLEHSFLRNDISSMIEKDDNTPSKYYLNSNFLKLIAEYTLQINSKAGLTFGVNYMYSNLKDNNSSHGNNYHNIAPTLSFRYYNPDKEIGVNYSINYENYQPTAGSLNDVTVTIISPYQIKRGNKDLNNSIGYFSNLSLTYKKLGIYLNAMVLTNDLSPGTTIVEDNNGQPLFVDTDVNYKKPITNIDLGVSYSNNISFWSTNIYASLTYALFNLEQAKNTFEKTSGFRGEFYMSNQFKLPLNFYIYLDSYYKTRGYQYVMLYEPTFNMDLAIEKRFLKDNLSISIKGSGILAEKIQGASVKEFGVYNDYKTKGYGKRRCFSINASWRFNNHKKVQQAKDNEYLNML